MRNVRKNSKSLEERVRKKKRQKTLVLKKKVRTTINISTKRGKTFSIHASTFYQGRMEKLSTTNKLKEGKKKKKTF